MPSSVLPAAWPAKDGPCSMHTNTDTGPASSGSPVSQPLTPGPQRRPAALVTYMISGVSVSLARKRITVPGTGPAARTLLFLRRPPRMRVTVPPPGRPAVRA